jgi:DNA-binding LytR/AlgR family response regulator
MMTQKRKFFVRGVLSDVERMLPSPDFLRVHRSALLNTRQLTSASSSEYVAVTSSGYRVPISRARIRALRSALEQLGVPTVGYREGQ